MTGSLQMTESAIVGLISRYCIPHVCLADVAVPAIPCPALLSPNNFRPLDLTPQSLLCKPFLLIFLLLSLFSSFFLSPFVVLSVDTTSSCIFRYQYSIRTWLEVHPPGSVLYKIHTSRRILLKFTSRARVIPHISIL